MDNLNLKKYLANQGYYFEEELLENFLLSFKVKPFIILSGNPGTGKTKLPQLFANFMSDDKNDRYMIKVSTLKRSHLGGKDKQVGWGIYKEYLDSVLPIDKINGKYEVEIGGFRTQADFSLGIQLYYDYDNEEIKRYFKRLYDKEQLMKKKDKELGRKHEQQMVNLSVSYESLLNLISDNYINNKEITLKATLTKSAVRGEEKLVPFEIFEYMPFNKKSKTNICVNGLFANAQFEVKLRMRNYATNEIKEYLDKLYEMDESHFELKIRGFEHDFDDFKSFMEDSLENRKNYEIMPVGTDWCDGSHILGYHNVITDEYKPTPFYELIKYAQNDLNNPYFLILDEMNLAPIEQYFADFLSVVESGETIPLYGTDELLEIPKNIFIIGTVNGNENNPRISPNVLDRVNVIELDSRIFFDFIDSKSNVNSFNKNINYLESPLMDYDISLVNVVDLKGILLNISVGEDNLWELISNELANFQKILKGSYFEFSFRVIDEILKFMVVSWNYEGSPSEWNNWERYFDAQIKQRILPKLFGSKKDIEEIILNLFNLCLKKRKEDVYLIIEEISKSDCRYYESAIKLQNMYEILSKREYVSFI